MNNLKRIFALMLCVALVVVCFAGCHEKGEISVKIGDVEFTSGYYACALVYADTEARSKVVNSLPQEMQNSEIDFSSQKIDGMEYEAWVEKTALDDLKTHAAIKTLCKQNKVELDSETLAQAKAYAEFLWVGSDYYPAYSLLMEANGVALDTFIEYETVTYLKDAYFDAMYGKGGKKEITADEISKYIGENYVLVNKIEVPFSGLKDEEKTEKKNQLAGYEASLKDKSKTFEEIYLAYNNQKAEDHKHEEPKDGEAPKDAHATILGAKDTSYKSDHYETAKAMAVGEVKLVTLEEDAGLVLLVKQDIMADPYYVKNEDLDKTYRTEIVGDKLDKEIETFVGSLKCEVNDSSISQFDIADIEYPEGYY